ncbi:MAG TPA: hypothetical protein QF753_09175 [Victivallales bacterium]|nr:hypothetical protein [Victivallales bacterium]|tara:strand:+ start:243 stop:575 length:333 start_codon:yes stop_codon:yes gene_type:complete
MKISNGIQEYYYYLKDKFNIKKVSVKIEKFELDKEKVIVLYRIGNKKLLLKECMYSFQNQYFEYLSFYDQHRVTKFSTLQSVLSELYVNSKTLFSLKKYISKEIKNEQLF